jgi:hypothetical protein
VAQVQVVPKVRDVERHAVVDEDSHKPGDGSLN